MWPDTKLVNQLFRGEALGLTQDELLSVHQAPLLKKRENNRYVTAGEDELFNSLLDCNNPNGYKIILLTGDSGSGKTHQVRWCHAKLCNRFSGNDNNVIIFLEVNSSLKDAVIKLLDQLGDEEDWVRIREQLNQAGAIISNVEDDIVRFCTEIVIQLSNDIRNQLCDRPALNQQLAELFSDLGFIEKIQQDSNNFINILIRSLYDPNDQSLYVQRSRPLRLEDFYFKDLVDMGLPETVEFLYNNFELGVDVEASVQIIKDCWNGASKRLFASRYAVQINVLELFNKIREKLFNQGKNLFLLIEDYVNLSGIQDSIREGLRSPVIINGERRLCDLHALIASTPGQINLDTFDTRSEKWIIEFPTSEQGDHYRIADLIGRYLFACRTPSDQRLDENGNPKNEKIVFDGNIEHKYECFGNINGNYLFPFSEKMLKVLQREMKLKVPREIINACRTLLVNGNNVERTFLEQFNSDIVRIDHSLSQKILANVNNNDQVWARIIVYYYGNNSDEIDPGIFKYFGIGNPFKKPNDKKEQTEDSGEEKKIGEKVPKIQEQTKTNIDDPTIGNEQTNEREKQLLEFKKLEDSINSWNLGNHLDQVVSRELQELIRDAFKENLDWNTLLTKYNDSQKGSLIEKFYLFNFYGKIQQNSIVLISEDGYKNPETLSRVVDWLLAICYRKVFSGFNSDSPIIHDKSPYFWYRCYNDFIDQFRDRFIEVHRNLEDTEKLIRDSILLSIASGRKIRDGEDFDLVKMFIEPEVKSFPGKYDDFSKLLNEVKVKLDPLLEKLKNLFGARQGDTGNALAIDVVSMKHYLNLDKINEVNLNTVLGEKNIGRLNNTIALVNIAVRRIQEGFGNEINTAATLAHINRMINLLNIREKDPVHPKLVLIEGHALYLSMTKGEVTIPHITIIDENLSSLKKLEILRDIDLNQLNMFSSFVEVFNNFHTMFLKSNPTPDGEDEAGIGNARAQVIANLKSAIDLLQNFGGINDNN